MYRSARDGLVEGERDLDASLEVRVQDARLRADHQAVLLRRLDPPQVVRVLHARGFRHCAMCIVSALHIC